MRLLLAILIVGFAASLIAATNVQHIQTFRGGTNGEFLASSVLNAGAVGTGAWDLQSGFTNRYQFWKVGTNFPFRFPFWVTQGGTNYDATPTNWVYYDLKGYDVANEWEQYRFTAPGGASGGFRSNMWVGYYLLLDGVSSASLSAPNIDPLIMAGSAGNFSALQLAIRTNNNHLLYAHGGGSNGWKFAVSTNVLYLVTKARIGLTGASEVRVFNATNNFSALTNDGGAVDSSLYVSRGYINAMDDTNAYEIRITANYLNGVGGEGTATGRIWMSSPIIGFGDSALPPTPETNVIVSDRYAPLVVGSSLGIRGTRPVRTLETNVSVYGASTSSDDNSSAINTAISTAASNTVVLFDQIYKIRGTVTFNKDGVTLRGTNGGGILLGAGGTFNRGPTALSAGQAKILWVTNGITKGATNATLMTNYAVANTTGFISPNESYQLTQLNGRDPQNRMMNMSGADRSVSVQEIRILSTNGNSIVFWPPAMEDFTNQPAMIQRFATVRLATGMENFTITTTNAGVYETNAGSHNLQWQGEAESWMTGCQILYANNYGADFNYLLNCEANSNLFRYPSVRSGSHGGLQISGGAGLYLYDNIIADHNDRSIQFFGGAWVGLAGNYMTNTSGQGVRYHAPGNVTFWEGNICDGCYLMLGDGYFGSNKDGVAFRNEVLQFDFKRLSHTMSMVGNVTAAAYTTGFPNIGNLETNGLSKYDGPLEERTLVSGWRWDELSTNFTGNFGVSPYLGASYSNISFTFTDVATQVAQGTNIVGSDFSHWPYSANGGYSIVFWDGTRWWRYADFTNSPTEQIAVDLRAWIQPSNGVMVLNRYMPISNGWTMYVTGPDNLQQRQTIDNVTFQETLGLVNGVASYDVNFLPKSFPASLLFPDGAPAWALTNSFRWPWVQPESVVPTTNNPAKARFIAMSATYTNVTNAPPRIRGFRFR